MKCLPHRRSIRLECPGGAWCGGQCGWISEAGWESGQGRAAQNPAPTVGEGGLIQNLSLALQFCFYSNCSGNDINGNNSNGFYQGCVIGF